MTLNENLADNGGLKLAYRAYVQFEAKNGPEQLLPGLHLTQRQLFWLSAANAWCGVERPQYTRYFGANETTSPRRFRVIGSMSNMAEFAEDWKCRKDAKMNPQNKCSLWG